MAAVADLDALLVEELLRASEILTDITMDLEYRGGTRGSKQSGKSGGSGAGTSKTGGRAASQASKGSKGGGKEGRGPGKR